MNKIGAYLLGVITGIMLVIVLTQPIKMVVAEIENYNEYKQEQQEVSAFESFLKNVQEDLGVEITIKK